MTENNKNCRVEKQKPLGIKVKSIESICDPFESWVWSEPVSKIEVSELVKLFEFDDSNRELHRTCYKLFNDYEKIAWFVVNGWDDPISIDVGVPECTGFLQQWIVTDGNHRLAAAIYRGDETIMAHIDGRNEYMKELFAVCYMDEEEPEDKVDYSWVETDDDYEYMSHI